jgi:HTH-type transcriptional regulator/antitoxin HigA
LQLIEPLLRFFGVASSAGWQEHYGQRLQANFRRAQPDKQTDVPAISAWLRLGELAAQDQDIAHYDAARLEAALPHLRALTTRSPDEISAGLKALCDAAGVHLAFVPALPGTHVSGVARWLPTGRPLVQLSLRGKWNDIFWFSFFHELGHLLKHPKRSIFLDDGSASHPDESPEEREANTFARDWLIPPAHQPDLEALPLDAASVQAFAAHIGIHPGIVVGQLQNRGRITYASALTKLKTRYAIATP